MAVVLWLGRELGDVAQGLRDLAVLRFSEDGKGALLLVAAVFGHGGVPAQFGAEEQAGGVRQFPCRHLQLRDEDEGGEGRVPEEAEGRRVRVGRPVEEEVLRAAVERALRRRHFVGAEAVVVLVEGAEVLFLQLVPAFGRGCSPEVVGGRELVFDLESG